MALMPSHNAAATTPPTTVRIMASNITPSLLVQKTFCPVAKRTYYLTRWKARTVQKSYHYEIYLSMIELCRVGICGKREGSQTVRGFAPADIIEQTHCVVTVRPSFFLNCLSTRLLTNPNADSLCDCDLHRLISPGHSQTPPLHDRTQKCDASKALCARGHATSADRRIMVV